MLALAAIAFMAGCTKSATDGEDKPELVILCGSSFVPAMEQLRKEFTAETGIAVVTTVAGSEDFLPLIRAGQKGDIVMAHPKKGDSEDCLRRP